MLSPAARVDLRAPPKRSWRPPRRTPMRALTSTTIHPCGDSFNRQTWSIDCAIQGRIRARVDLERGDNQAGVVEEGDFQVGPTRLLRCAGYRTPRGLPLGDAPGRRPLEGLRRLFDEEPPRSPESRGFLNLSE